jgi:hypothetical protein
LSAKAIFSAAYLPPIEYISALIKFPSAEIEQWENFQKQTIRNRCYILGANGVQKLHIPVLHEKKIKIFIKDLKICYHEPWQRIHWTALESAYNKSPFFEYYKDDFRKIIFSNKVFLLDLNTELLELILKIIRMEIKINFTTTFEKNYPENDFRFLSYSKKVLTANPGIQSYSYPQVFSYKFGFTPGLSIVDLVFNEGNACNSFLSKTDFNPSA